MTISPCPKEDEQQHHQQRIKLGLAGHIAVLSGDRIGVVMSWQVWMPRDPVIHISLRRLCKNEVRMCVKMAWIRQCAPANERKDERKKRSKKEQ